MTTQLVECPSGLRLHMSNLKLRQIRRLANRPAVRSGVVFDEMLDQLQGEVEDPGPYDFSGGPIKWGKVLQGDRFAALLAIRTATHGSKFEFDVLCQRCDSDEPILWELDLNDLQRQPYPPESIEAFREGRRIEATIGGRRVSWALVTGDEEKRVAKAIDARRKSHPKGRKGRAQEPDPLVDGLLARLQVDGVGPSALEDWLDDLDGAELAKLNTAMEDANGGIDTTLTVRHDTRDCTGVTKVELPFFNQAFWLPTTR